MKTKLIYFLTLGLLYSCVTTEKQPDITFVTYDETEALAKQKEHRNNRMKFKLFQSKVLDMNAVFAPFQEDLASFSEEDYQELKPLILEKDIPSLQKNVREGKLTYEKLTLFYLYRIRKFESDSTRSLNGIIALNPNVIEEARAKDKRKEEVSEYAMYGMPILLKDNINTTGMPTTAGALALEMNKYTDDAFIVKKIKDSGALILGKVNLSEWAYFFCSGCPLGYSAIGGQTLNPYGRAEFETGGSSSGSGVTVAANYAVAAVGTETSGSITSPSSKNSVVGLKPTIGVFSRSGIVPISSTLDTPGPMTKSVIDNAIFMNAMRGYDTKDDASKELNVDYLDANFDANLKGKRLGFITNLMNDSIYALNIQKLKEAGAEMVEISPENPNFQGFVTVLNIDMKYDLPKYIKNSADKNVTTQSIQDVVAFNKKDSVLRAPYGQQLFEGILADTTTLEELKVIKENLKAEGSKYLEALESKNLDAILSIDNYHSGIAAVSFHPTLTVPMGYKKSGEPTSLTFVGKPLSEVKLLELGYAFEQITKARKIPENYK